MTVAAALGVAQILEADPALATPKSQDGWCVQDGEAIGGLTLRRFSVGGRPPHPAPSLLLLSTGADFQLARRVYGRRHRIPRLHVLRGTDLSHWGHRAIEEPAVRVAIGDGIARQLRGQAIFREPVLCLPIGFDPATRPSPASGRQQEPLLLAGHQPQLGRALEHALRQRGITSRLELFPSARARLERAIARAPVVVDLGQPTGPANPVFPGLTAMALRTPLITVRVDAHHGLYRDGGNALVRDADVESLAEAVTSLLGDKGEGLRARLLDGARSTVAHHHPALQRLRFEELLLDVARHWQQACAAHASVHTAMGSAS